MLHFELFKHDIDPELAEEFKATLIEYGEIDLSAKRMTSLDTELYEAMDHQKAYSLLQRIAKSRKLKNLRIATFIDRLIASLKPDSSQEQHDEEIKEEE